MALQGSSALLQGGTGINVPTYNPQKPITLNLQQPTGISLQGTSGQIGAQAQKATAASAASTQALLAQIAAMNASNRQVYAPSIDLASINAQARQAASNAVTPLYQQKLNALVAQEAAKRAQSQQDAEIARKNIEDQLAQSQVQNETSRGRSTQDTATALGDINTTADRFQTSSGQQFDAERIAQARQLATSGLTSSGVGQQQIDQANVSRNVTEGQKEQDLQSQRVSTEVAKARTFEDLGTSDVLAGKTAERGKAATQLSLDRILQDLDPNNQAGSAYAGRQDLAAQQLRDQLANQQAQAKALVNNFIASIRDPASRQAAAQAYGGLF